MQENDWINDKYPCRASAISAAHDISSLRGSSAPEAISVVSPPFNPTVMRRPEGYPVVRFPEQLRLHRALDQLGWTGLIDELNEAVRLKNQSAPEPILVTTNGMILAGFGR